jgi:hypothetical protein
MPANYTLLPKFWQQKKSNTPLTPHIQPANLAFVIMPPLLGGGRQTMDRMKRSVVYGPSAANGGTPYDEI